MSKYERTQERREATHTVAALMPEKFYDEEFMPRVRELKVSRSRFLVVAAKRAIENGEIIRQWDDE